MTDYTKLIQQLNEESQDNPDDYRYQAAEAIEALQAECAEHKENAIRNARIAVSIRAERDQLQAENERLQSALAQCRDAFPTPAQGSPLEQDWAAAMGEPESVPDFVKASVDAMGKGEPIYQYLMGDGSWIDQAKQSYDYNRNNAPHAVMRIVYAAPKALAPLTDKEDWDVRGILASKLRVFHRTTEAEAEELISLFSSMKSRTPLTQPEVVEAFCNTRHNTQYVSVFDAGVRFAEKHHGIGGTP